jgi:hypothetical protein
MRVAHVLAVTTLVLGGLAACTDHYPKVVFQTDAGNDGKSEAGAPQDTGAGGETATVPDAPSAVDVGIQGADVPLAVDVALEANRSIDVSSLDASVDVAVDASVALDGAQAVDGAGTSAIDAGIDSSATVDGGKVGG